MPTIPSSLFILVIFIFFIFFGIRVQYDTIPEEKEFSFEPILKQNKKAPLKKTAAENKLYIPKACQNTDFQWMASDRQYWDGWSSKSMFLRPDGKFTRGNIDIQQHESICVAVLLGPIPAVASINADPHSGPSDSIIMNAVNKEDGVKIPLRLYQHQKQSNAYFAEIEFSQPGVYRLETTVEYRSYFWEFPAFHKYTPYRFLSRNKLTVRQGLSKKKVECEMDKPMALKDSTWLKENNSSTVLTFVPSCELKKCSLPKYIHIWGDDLIKRNMKMLVDKKQPVERCTELRDNNHYDFNTPITYNDDTFIHFGLLNTKIVDNSMFWRQYIQNIIANANTNDAEVVILGVGNEDLGSLRQDPKDFAKGFNEFLTFMMNDVYPKQTIIVKTTRWITKSVNGFNYGRSQAYADIIRSTVTSLGNNRVLLWDTHQLGIKDNECKNHMSLNNNVVSLENDLLASLFC